MPARIRTLIATSVVSWIMVSACTDPVAPDGPRPFLVGVWTGEAGSLQLTVTFQRFECEIGGCSGDAQGRVVYPPASLERDLMGNYLYSRPTPGRAGSVTLDLWAEDIDLRYHGEATDSVTLSGTLESQIQTGPLAAYNSSLVLRRL